jgi:putative NADPH-quinone reductase
MRVLHLYCHPLPESFHAALRTRALAGLAKAGHEVDMLDLYAEGFDPVLGADERRHYHDTTANRRRLEPWIARLEQADGLVVQFPTWCFGPPAILKGFLDRVLIPGVAFDLSDPARVRPLLGRIHRLAGIVTYGQPRLRAMLMSDPPRRIVTRYLPRLVAEDATTTYQALYHMNVASQVTRERFLDRVGTAMGRF